MPVESQTPFNEYTGNGVTTVFAYQFQVLIATDLAVFVDGAIKANGTDYTISGVGNQQGGQITFTSAPAAGADVLLARQMVLARDTDYQTNGDLREAVLDRDFDRIWLVLQSINAAVSGTLRLPFPEMASPLPPAVQRRDRLLGFNLSTGAPQLSNFTMSQVANAIAAAYGTGSTLDALTFLQDGIGAKPRTAQDKAREIYSVADFGALGDGSDQTQAFSDAAKAASAAVPANDNSTANIERAKVATILVPDGDYLLTDIVDTGGIDIRWIFEDATKVTGYQNYLPGIIYRSGNKVSAETYGTGDYATAFKIYANHTNKEQMAGVSGFQTPGAIASRYGRDSCGLDVEIVAPPLLASSSNCTFTASRVTLQTPLNASVVKRMRKGMIVDTSEPAGQFKYSGFVVGWDSSGLWIDVSGWFQFGGGGIAATPPNGLSVYINPITNAIGRLTYATLNADSYANRAIGGETDIVNNKIAPVPYPLAGAFSAGDNSPDLIGRLISSFGTVGKGTTALKTEGDWIYGAFIRNADYGLWYNKTGGTALVAGRGASKILAGHSSGGNEEIYLSNNRLKFKAGANGTATASLIDFVTGGSDIDYDVRIQASSGNGALGNGSLSFTSGDIRLLAGTTMFGGTLRPFADNAYSVGTTIFRPTQLFAVSGTINTSDGREKTEPKEIEDAVLDAWGEVRIICYQWLHAIALKGADAARIHYGVIAQQVRDVFANRGIDATIYGFLCYDKWEAQRETIPEVTIQHPPEYSTITGLDGEPLVNREAWVEVVEPERTVVIAEAGDRWGIREGQCLWLEAGWQRRETRRMQERLKRLEDAAGLESITQ